MRNLVTTKADVNVEKLDADLRAAFPVRFAGLSRDGAQITLHFTDDISAGEETTALGICTGHDHTSETSDQQRLRQIREALIPARDNAPNLTPDDVTGQSAMVQQIVADMYRLRLEILFIRENVKRELNENEN